MTARNIRINNRAPFVSGSDSGEIYTLGLHAEVKPNPHWSWRAEGAYEWGMRNDRDPSAFGCNGRLAYGFNDALKNQIHLDLDISRAMIRTMAPTRHSIPSGVAGRNGAN